MNAIIQSLINTQANIRTVLQEYRTCHANPTAYVNRECRQAQAKLTQKAVA